MNATLFVCVFVQIYFSIILFSLCIFSFLFLFLFIFVCVFFVVVDMKLITWPYIHRTFEYILSVDFPKSTYQNTEFNFYMSYFDLLFLELEYSSVL